MSVNLETLLVRLGRDLTQRSERIFDYQLFTLLSEHDSETARRNTVTLGPIFSLRNIYLNHDYWSARSMKVEMLRIFIFNNSMFPTTCFTPLDCRNQRASELFLFKSIDNLFAALQK